MSGHFRIFVMLLSGGLVISSAAEAFFPFPSPLTGKDPANLALDKVENLTAKLEDAEQKLATAQKEIEEAKAGAFGPLAQIKGYTEALKGLDIKKAVPKLEMPDFLGKNTNNKDKMAAEAEKNLVVKYDETGNQNAVIDAQNLKRTEILQNNIATLYAHALATRTNLAKERELPPMEVNAESAREVLAATRALTESMARRYNDILFMEAQILEFNTAGEVTDISLSKDMSAAGEGG